MKCEVAISNRSGDVTGRMRHPATPSHPTAPVIQPPVIQQSPVQQPPANQQPSGLSDSPKSQTNKDRDRDLSDCEREAAFAGAGDKRQVFDKCMKARGY
jgi:hypothetical protein